MDFKSDKNLINADMLPLINYQEEMQQPEIKPSWYAVGYIVFTVAVVVLLALGLAKRGLI
jgi:hypothetical protein